MDKQKIYQTLTGVKMSEKVAILTEQANQYAFTVSTEATKQDVKEAVTELFGVTVSSVRILNIKGKQKFFGRKAGRRNAVRKAYVTLPQGQEINLESMG